MKLRNKKTGEVAEVYLDNYTNENNIVSVCLKVKDDVSPDGYKYIASYTNLVELLGEWEDYAPKEPLIKDEKIRKAVRAWAEALDTDSCSFRADHDIFDFIAIGANCLRFDMSDGWGTYKLEDIPNGYYHITELCGEEE